MKSDITLGAEHVGSAQDIRGNTDDKKSRQRCHLTAWWESFLNTLILKSDLTYGCAYQDAGGKPSNAWQLFYAELNYSLAHKLSKTSVNTISFYIELPD